MRIKSGKWAEVADKNKEKYTWAKLYLADMSPNNFDDSNPRLLRTFVFSTQLEPLSILYTMNYTSQRFSLSRSNNIFFNSCFET